MDTCSAKNALLLEAITYEQKPSEDKRKKHRGSPCKQNPEDNLELAEKNPTSSLNNACTFDDFRGLNVIGKVRRKRSARRRNYLPSPEVHTTDHRKESWSGLCLYDDPIDTLREASANTRPRRRQRLSKETYVPSSDLSSPVPLQLGLHGPKKQIQLIRRSIIHIDEKRIDEVMPTALVLSFDRSAVLPSEVDLIRLFSRYGPLKETETEVHQNMNTVKVVFKKHVDAKSAFSVVGKYGSFGPSLHSFCLVQMPFSLSELNPEDRTVEIPAARESRVDTVQVDIIS